MPKKHCSKCVFQDHTHDGHTTEYYCDAKSHGLSGMTNQFAKDCQIFCTQREGESKADAIKRALARSE